MADILDILKETLEITWPVEPFYDESKGYYFVVNADTRHKILACLNETFDEIIRLRAQLKSKGK